MNKISKYEVLIEGKWVSVGSKVEADDSCKRVQWLTTEILELIATDGDNWQAFYQDPADNRFWVMFYPQSELHGGGPPSLRVATELELKKIINAK